MPTRPYDPKKSTALPAEYAGKWVAWNSDHSRVVAHSETFPDLWRIVRDRNINNPVFEKVPRADVLFVG